MNDISVIPEHIILQIAQREVSEKKTRKRYRLHYLIRKSGFVLKTKERTVFVKVGSEYPSNKHLNSLVKEFGYVIQTHI